MSHQIRVRLSESGIREAMGAAKLRQEIETRAAAIRDACNAQSSWGGYKSGPESENWRASANVWTIDAGGTQTEARANRMLRNVDAGR